MIARDAASKATTAARTKKKIDSASKTLKRPLKSGMINMIVYDVVI